MLEALDRSPAIIQSDLAGQMVDANERFLGLMGYRIEEIRGYHHRMLCNPAHAESPEYRQLWARLTRGEYHSGEFQRVAKDGSSVWVQATYNPVRDFRGRTVKVVKFAADISTQKSLFEVQQLIDGVPAAAASMRGELEDITRGNEDSSQRTQDQIARLDQTADAVDEMTSSVHRTAEHAAEVDRLARDATELAAARARRSIAGRVSGLLDTVGQRAAAEGDADPRPHAPADTTPDRLQGRLAQRRRA